MGRDGTLLDPTVVRALLQKLRPAASDVVLIGGQALNFWAERYGNAPELAGAAPYTSRDIDFYGQREHVTRCAQLLGGESTLHGPRDRSICSGIVTTADGVQIDFVATPRGVPPSEVPRKAITFAHGRVMHPIHVLMSRAANVIGQMVGRVNHGPDELRRCHLFRRRMGELARLARGRIELAAGLVRWDVLVGPRPAKTIQNALLRRAKQAEARAQR